MVKGFCSIKAFAPPTHLPPTLQYFTTCRMVFLILPKPAQLGFILLSFRWRCRPSVWRLCGVLLQPDVLSVEIQDTLSGQDQGRHSNEPLRFDNHNPGWIYSTAAAASIWKIIILGHKFRRNSNSNINSIAITIVIAIAPLSLLGQDFDCPSLSDFHLLSLVFTSKNKSSVWVIFSLTILCNFCRKSPESMKVWSLIQDPNSTSYSWVATL